MYLILAQTDTTVGFLSQDASRLNSVKGREEGKPYLKVFSSFKVLQEHTRIPLKYRIWFRHAHKTTFVIKNQAFRYVSQDPHSSLITKYGWFYSTSANESGKYFDRNYCEEQSDLIIEDSRGLQECAPSKIFKLTSTKFKRLR
jgi:tRNA A37 threonylcarbamoyladenosine synthetase subunit TsaC/SUA5/YrdC